MTDKPTPTDAELKALWQLHAADIGGIFYYARAVLAKWGQPAQAAEPVAWLDPWTGTKVTTDYLGDPRPWHRFAKVEAPHMCWSEVLTSGLARFEETKGTK